MEGEAVGGVWEVDHAGLRRGDGDVLTLGGHAGVQLRGHPGPVPAAHRAEDLVLRSVLVLEISPSLPQMVRFTQIINENKREENCREFVSLWCDEDTAEGLLATFL